jgi:hypothetical protein
MTKKLPDNIMGWTRNYVNEEYKIEITDKQWELLVDWCDDDEIVDVVDCAWAIQDFIKQMDFLEKSADEYDRLLVEIHGQEGADRINGN